LIIKNVLRSAALVTVVIAAAGCTATPEKPSASTPGVVFDKPIAKVQKAAIDALTANGFEIGKSEPTYVEGTRPHKVGLAVGSGGESAGVWLESLTPARTSVKVDTAKSLVGIAGQKSWNAEIISALDKSVGPHE
jgi:hypothetical protein